MQDKYVRKCSLCLIKEEEVTPFLQELKKEYPDVDMQLQAQVGSLELVFEANEPVDHLTQRVFEQFPSFFYQEKSIEEALHQAMIEKKLTLALAESCTGGAVAARLTKMADASQYLLGSIVAYSNAFKERFLHVSRTTLNEKGAVSKECVIEMVHGLLEETDADFAVAISGIAGPSGGSREKPVGTVYVAIGQRGTFIDVGLIQGPSQREEVIELSVKLVIGAIWRRVVHKTATFS